MRFFTRLVLSIVLTMGVLFPVGRVSALDTTPDLQAVITSTDPEHASLQLKNISSRACQAATTTQGTVAITEVKQNGKLLQPQALDAASDEDIGYLLQSQLKTIKPGESVTLPLLVYKLPSGHILRSTTWSGGAGTLSSQYAIQAKQPLVLKLNYSLPITPKKGEPACGAVFASSVADQARLTPLVAVMATVAFVIMLALMLLLWFLYKRQHRVAKPTTAALLLLAIGVGAWLMAPRAYADISVPPDMQSAFDGCMETFNANSDITGPVLDVINNPANHIVIVRTSGGSDMTGYGNTFTIYWNPDDHHAYAGGGNADPCTTLYHEMYHALDMSNGTFSRDDCAGSGIETKEVMATRAQNVLRERLGMPPRSHYGDRALPSGDCSAPANPAECTGEHCGDTNGDPHLRTFDGLRYDFQATGEFIIARNGSGSYEIQARQEPWAGSRTVSLNTAVALKIENDRLEIRAGQALELLVNGKRQSLEAGELPGGGQLSIERGVVILTWIDGSKAFVRSVGPYGLALSVQPSADRAGKLEGLLGDANGNSNNDLRIRGSGKAVKATHKELYPAYADSWRITDKTSLFTYASGETTASYTDRSFPDEMPDPKTLPGYAAAEVYCKSFGITDPAVLANCALDIAITGRPEFARAAANSQVFAAGANYGGTTWDLVTKNPGDSASVTFEGTASEKIFVQVVQTTLPSQCGILKLFGPDSKQIADGCVINGSGEIDGTLLPTTGTYTITLSPGDRTGTATLRLLRISDKQGTIAPERSITAHIDKPGVVGRYTFAGQAGQRVYIDVPSSTLESRCGILRLLQSNGHEIGNGCIINNVGNIDTITLPANDTYTIVVDPTDDATGSATLRFYFATAESKAIAMDGSTLTTKLTKPGSIAQFTFNGVAGQRIFVDLPSSELPSQCGIVLLRAPDGTTTGSGCVINGKGNLADDGTILPTTGTYTIILDPNDAVTGTTTIRLRSR